MADDSVEPEEFAGDRASIGRDEAVAERDVTNRSMEVRKSEIGNRKSEIGSRKSEEVPKVGSEQAFDSADGLRRPPLQRQGKDGDKKRQATAEAKTRKGQPSKRKDGKGQEQGKAKQDGGVNPKKSRPLQKAAAAQPRNPH